VRRFNLIDEQWIPLRLLDGGRIDLGIRDTLLRAREFAAIEDPSPLVVASLHRFLLAVLYRSLEGPCDITEAKTLFKEGLPAEKIVAYLGKWRDRFWLFDETFPFSQIPSFEPKIWRSWTVLAAEHNADNAKVLFDHIDVQEPGEIDEATATRWLLATQTFAVSCGKSELSHTGTAPSATAALAIPLGKNLQDTLLMSLIPQGRQISDGDKPLWERSPEVVTSLKESVNRDAIGLADRYTWRTRSIRFRADNTGIAQLAFASGVNCSSLDQVDPMQAYRIDEKNGRLPIQFRDRGLWRDFDSLLPDKEKLSPRSLEHALSLTQDHPDRFPTSVMVLGQSNDKAKIEFWRMERFALPPALAGDRCIREDIHRFLDRAETSQKALWSACNTFARYVIARGERKPDGKDTKAFLAQMPCIPAYWASLEAAFHVILQAYTLDQDPYAIERDWVIAVRDALSSAWDQHRRTAITGDAWTIRALVKAEGAVVSELKKLEATIKEFNNFLAKEEA
jgi:CRISPR system Cascade subunit CasA